MTKTELDQIACAATDALASHGASVGDAAAVMLQILAGAQAFVKAIGEDADPELANDFTNMNLALRRARAALAVVQKLSEETGGAL